MSKTTRTTEVIKVTITNISAGDTSGRFTKKYQRELAKEMKERLDVDDVSVDSVKAFVMEENDKVENDPMEAAMMLSRIWLHTYNMYIDHGFSEQDALSHTERFVANLVRFSKECA